jgi:hypothetical protein
VNFQCGAIGTIRNEGMVSATTSGRRVEGIEH